MKKHPIGRQHSDPCRCKAWTQRGFTVGLTAETLAPCWTNAQPTPCTQPGFRGAHCLHSGFYLHRGAEAWYSVVSMIAQRFKRLPTIEWRLCNNPAFLVLAGFPPLAENRGWTDVGRISETRAQLRAISGPSAGQNPTTGHQRARSRLRRCRHWFRALPFFWIPP